MYRAVTGARKATNTEQEPRPWIIKVLVILTNDTNSDILRIVIYRKEGRRWDSISSGALTGETTLLVLLSLYKELHGYGVKLFIEEKTNGRVVLGMGTLIWSNKEFSWERMDCWIFKGRWKSELYYNWIRKRTG